MDFEKKQEEQELDLKKVQKGENEPTPAEKAKAVEMAQDELKKESKADKGIAKDKIAKIIKTVIEMGDGRVTIEKYSKQAQKQEAEMEKIEVSEGLKMLNISEKDIEELKKGSENLTDYQKYNKMTVLLAKLIHDSFPGLEKGLYDEKRLKGNKLNIEENLTLPKSVENKLNSVMQREEFQNGEELLSLERLIANSNSKGTSTHVDGIDSKIKKLTGYQEDGALKKFFNNSNKPDIYKQMTEDLAREIGFDMKEFEKISEIVKAGEKYNKSHYSKRAKKAVEEGRTYGGSSGTEGSIMKDPEYLINVDLLSKKMAA